MCVLILEFKHYDHDKNTCETKMSLLWRAIDMPRVTARTDKTIAFIMHKHFMSAQTSHYTNTVEYHAHALREPSIDAVRMRQYDEGPTISRTNQMLPNELRTPLKYTLHVKLFFHVPWGDQ